MVLQPPGKLEITGFNKITSCILETIWHWNISGALHIFNCLIKLKKTRTIHHQIYICVSIVTDLQIVVISTLIKSFVIHSMPFIHNRLQFICTWVNFP